MLDAGKKHAKRTDPPKPRAADPVVPEVRTGENLSFQLFTQPPVAAASGGDAPGGPVGMPEPGTPSPADLEPGARSSPVSAPFGVIVDDGSPLAEGQIHLSEFLGSLRPLIEQAGNEELAGSGRTTRACPYIHHWLDHYATRPAAYGERALARYANPERTDLEGLREALVARARRAIRVWVRSGGKQVQSPEGIDPLGDDDGLSREGGASAVQRKALDSGAGPPPPATNPAAVRARLGEGAPLGGDVRGRMERGFGQSFADVRLHTDGGAARLASGYSARAFTVGTDVAFGAGQYRPGTLIGDALLAHELAHVLQQRGGGDGPAAGRSAALEADADRAAIAVMQGREARPGVLGGLRLQRCDELGSGYDPQFHEEYHENPPTPEEMIDLHTDNGDLDEDALGETLYRMAWYTPRHYDYIRRVFEALDPEDRDDVAAAMVSHTQDSDLAEIATTEEGQALLRYIVPELTEGWETGGETYAAVRVLRALRAYEAAKWTVEDELDDMRTAVGAAEAPANPPVELLTAEQVRVRLRLVEVHLDSLERKWTGDTDVVEAITAVRGRLAASRTKLAADLPTVSRYVQIAQQVLETCELVIDGTGQQIAGLQTELRRRGTEAAHIELLQYVRARFVDALGAAMGPDAPLRFAQASAALQQLSLSQTDLELAVLAERPGLFEAVEPKLVAMRTFATWVVSELHAVEAEVRSIRQAEQQGTNVSARRTAAEERLERVSLSHRLLAHWDVVIQVAEALESGFSFTEAFYGHDVDVDSLHTRLEEMSDLAVQGDLTALRDAVSGYEGDTQIQDYYEDVPSILRSSGIVVAIAVMIAAIVVTWGVGAIFAAPAGAGAGAAAGTTATTVTAGGVAAGVGTTFLNALVFTSVHRGLSEVAGLGAHGSFFEDLLWNFGLFGVMRVASVGVRAGLAARGLARLTRPVMLGTSFGLLETYGVVRFRVEEGRLPTGAEFASMTAQTVVLLAAIAGGHAVVARLSPLGRFQARWGRQFEAIRLEQRALEREAQRALEQGRTGAFEAELRQRGNDIQARLRTLVEQVIAEGYVDALKTQLEQVLSLQVSQAALTESMGLLPEVALRSEGTPNSFSYRHGESSRLTEGLRGLRPDSIEVRDAAGRARVIELRFGDRPSLYFVERAAERPASTATAEPALTPAERNAARLDAAKDALQRRRIDWSSVPEDLRDLESARPRAQTKAETIRETADRLGRLETWIGARTETPWQSGREVKIEVTSGEAQARVARLPAGSLRNHLENNSRSAIVYGALAETTPGTAGSRMQALWDAWVQAGQEGHFAEFAESRLVEAGAVELRASGDAALAALLESEARVQNAFGRMGYDAGRLRAVHLYYEHGYRPGSGSRLSFAEYLQHEVGSLQGEGRSWAERRGNLGVRIPEGGFEPLRTRLADLTSAGTLTETDARIVWRWNAMIQSLVNDSAARVPGAASGSARATAVLDYLLEGVGKNFSESTYRAFRHRIRGLVVDDILYLRGGADTSASPATHDGTPVRAWAEQLSRLETWEGRVPQGDSASIGALWTAYAEARFAMGLPGGSTVAAIETIPNRNLRLPDGRMGDAALKFGARTDPSAPEPGEWAADYKGGVDPYDANQASNYSTRITENSGQFSMGGKTYRGLVYIFRSATAADAAARSMNAEGLHANLKVGYFNASGAIVWVR